ncbi:MAG: response regulator [Pirellulales bacterium]|nr:response regulator [Pirellulales bacterium]
MYQALLLVDDDANVLQGLTRSLRQEPYKIFTARTVEEAVCVLKTQSVGVIVTDEQMPGYSGIEFLVWAAEHYPHVRRIILTGHPSAEVAIRAINLGMVHQFFTKPCNEDELAAAIRKGLQEPRRPQPCKFNPHPTSQ